jgi:hypothetical protein
LPGGTPTNEHHVLVCIGVVDVGVRRARDRSRRSGGATWVREDAEEVVVVLDSGGCPGLNTNQPTGRGFAEAL